jgi:plasmid stabilization system protein ParE
MYKLIILPPATEDIREAAKWYEAKRPGLEKKFTAEIREKVVFIRQNPTSSIVRYDNVRTSVLNIFPYMIHYVIDEDNRAIIIIAMLHTSRNPILWKSKK